MVRMLWSLLLLVGWKYPSFLACCCDGHAPSFIHSVGHQFLAQQCLWDIQFMHFVMKMRRMLQQQQSIRTQHPNLLDVLFALWLTINSCLCICIADDHQHKITIAIPILYDVPYLQLVVIFFLSGIHITTSTFILFCTLCWQVVPFPSCCVCTLATGFTQNDFLGRRRKTNWEGVGWPWSIGIVYAHLNRMNCHPQFLHWKMDQTIFKVNGADLVVQLNGGSIAFLRFSLNSLCNV